MFFKTAVIRKTYSHPAFSQDRSADSTNSDSITAECNSTKKSLIRKSRAETWDVAMHGDRRVKAKQTCSSWFMLHMDKPKLDSIAFLKDFRKRIISVKRF